MLLRTQIQIAGKIFIPRELPLMTMGQTRFPAEAAVVPRIYGGGVKLHAPTDTSQSDRGRRGIS